MLQPKIFQGYRSTTSTAYAIARLIVASSVDHRCTISNFSIAGSLLQIRISIAIINGTLYNYIMVCNPDSEGHARLVKKLTLI